MARKRTEVAAGSGNVFADLGYADARSRSLKVELAMEVNRILGELGLAQDRAAKLLGIRQPHVSDLVRYRLNRFSVERLMDFLTRLGRDVEIRIAPRRSGRRRSAVQVRQLELRRRESPLVAPPKHEVARGGGVGARRRDAAAGWLGVGTARDAHRRNEDEGERDVRSEFHGPSSNGVFH